MILILARTARTGSQTIFRKLSDLDHELLDWIYGHRSPITDVFMAWVTWLGSGLFTISLSALLFLFGRSSYLRETAKLSLFANIGGGIFSWIVKLVVNRPRPPVPRIGLPAIFDDMSLSFPSGHATSVFATAVVFGWRYPRLRIPLLVFALLIAYSRVYLGEHFPLDVLAGAAIGCLAAAIALMNSKIRNREKP